MFDKKIKPSKLILIISLFFLTFLLIPVAYKVALFSISNKTEYLLEKLKNLELLYSFEYSDTKSSIFYAFRLDKKITARIKKEGITYLQKDNRLYEKCKFSIYNCKWRATPIDENMGAYKGLQRGLDRKLDVRVWLEMEGKNGYYFAAKNGTVAIVVLPRLSLLLYATGD